MNIRIEQYEGWTEVNVEGRLDALESENLYVKICELADKGEKDLRLDLREVDFISSAGIRTMLQSVRKLSSIKGQFRIIRASYAVQQSLSLSGLSNIIVPGRQPVVKEGKKVPQATCLMMKEEVDGKKLVMTLSGRLDAVDAEKLYDKVCEHANKGVTEMEFDTSDLEYMSSGGIRALLQTHRKMKTLGGTMHVSKASFFVLDALSMSGLSSLLIKK